MKFGGKLYVRDLVEGKYAYYRQTGGERSRANYTLILCFCFVSEYDIIGLDILSLRRALLICV